MLEEIRNQVQSELRVESARKAWFRARVSRVLDHYEAHDVLSRFGCEIKADSSRGQSIPCPFHGDNRPSAKLQPANAKGPSHLWCYVCRKNWNAIELWRDFQSIDFAEAVTQMERNLGLTPLPLPRHDVLAEVKAQKEVFAEKLQMLERMTRNRRLELGMERYVKFSLALDKLWVILDQKPQSIPGLVEKYLDKLCPGT